jgi:hypothetical protein
MELSMKWTDTVASTCRWAEFAEENWGDWDFLWEDSEADYQGYAEFIAYKDEKYVHMYWTYGSCGGCDPWEDMSSVEAKNEFNNSAIYFESFELLKKWIDMKSRTEKERMTRAVWEHAFRYELEKILSN